ncbi:MAG TPA: acyl-CoA dehydrogenase, partial [Steroidobacteraceae bacterium]|nr:acyl-CoA dehydrogenase [Steroidobacteraceae bacterium]
MDTPPGAALGDGKDDLVPAFADSARALAGRLCTDALSEKDAWREISAAGWLSILVPETMDGLGLDLRHVAAVHEQLGRTPTRAPVIACGVLPTVLLARLSQSGLRDSLLQDIQSGKLVVGVAWQDQVGQIGLNASSSVACNTDGSGYVLQGTKRWVVSAKDVDGWLVDATDQCGLRKIFWLPSDAPEVEIQPYEVIDTYAAYELVLSEVTVGELIAEGDIATEAIDHAVDIARIAQGAELIGLARASFELTLDYLKTRVQFGKPIGANQALQHRMVDAYVRLEMAAAGVQSAIKKYLANELPLAEAASWAKSRGADVALMMTRLAVQLHGAIGITDEYQLGQYWKRAHFVSGWLGGPERHSARHLEQHQARELHSQSATKSPNAHADKTDFETASIEDFREVVRSFLKQNYPPALRNPPRRLRLHEIKDWLSTLARKGWLAPAWPRQYGGMGLTPAKLIAFVEEFEDFGAARTPDQGIINVGPILI